MKRKPVPSYLLHQQSGRARAVWTARDGIRRQQLLPGPYDSAESRAAFTRLMLEVETARQNIESRNGALVLAEVLLAYLDHAAQHYRHADGRPTSEIYEVKLVVRAVRLLYADTPVTEFGPLAVKAIRQQWVNEGRSRTECNRRVGIIRRILKWAVSEELVPVTVYQAVATVAGLQRGRTEARETKPITPVDDFTVEATLPFLNRHVRGLVEFQRLTGCRPGEACSLRRSEIDTGGAVWLYRPPHHKTAHRGKSRTIAIGPKAAALLMEFFTPNINDFVFSPRRAIEESRGPTNRRKNPKRQPGESYDRTSYTRAIARAVRLANVARCQSAPSTPPDQIPHWHPNQLRHAHATKVRKAFGLEHAGAALGHTKMSATEIYAERDASLAVEVAAKLG